jgi:DNA-binding protein HU-beta
VNRSEIVADIAARLAAQQVHLPKVKIDSVLSALQSAVAASLCRGEAVTIAGWGTWRVEKRAAREVRNPRNRELTVSLKPTKVPKWQAGRPFRQAVATGKVPGALEA